MITKPLTQAELQAVEHATKLLREHGEVVTQVVNDTEALLNNYVPILKTYVTNIVAIQNGFGAAVADILKSSRELKTVTGGTQNIIDFISATQRLNAILTPEFVTKLKGLTGT